MILGVDIGGTKIAAGVVAATGKVVSYMQIPTNGADGPEQVIKRLISLCRETIAAGGVSLSELAGVGVSCAGPLDWQAGIVKESPNLPGWVNVHLGETLGAALGVPVFLENDANAAAVGESLYGAGQGIKNMIYVTVSTGIGGGAILNGQLYHGENGFAAEVGHMTVVFDGRPCGCGNRGCLEAHASGTAIARQAQELAAAGQAPQLLAMAGNVADITAQTVADAARQGDETACHIWAEAMAILGAGIANIINCYNPHRIVIGGGLSATGDMLFTPVRQEALRRAMASLAAVVDIVPAQLHGQVGVIGAAAVAVQRLQTAEI